MIHWISTAANPRLPGWTENFGWKLHAVEAPEDSTFADVNGRRLRSLCGIRPRHGWTVDLFIDSKCKRCAKRAAERPAAKEGK